MDTLLQSYKEMDNQLSLKLYLLHLKLQFFPEILVLLETNKENVFIITVKNSYQGHLNRAMLGD